MGEVPLYFRGFMFHESWISFSDKKINASYENLFWAVKESPNYFFGHPPLLPWQE